MKLALESGPASILPFQAVAYEKFEPMPVPSEVFGLLKKGEGRVN